ncbi:MAG: TolC family protein [Planctomycetes bacterium]|nr:TolC family protein [Planctomycetota bacterium]
MALTLGLCAACVSYVPHPIDPVASQRAFRDRRLDAPELVEFARAVLPPGAPFPPARWDLTTLTLVALHENPELAAARARSDASRPAIESAGERPNPTLGLDAEYTANTGVLPWALGFTLDFPIELGGKRDARITLAERESELARIEYAAAAWRVRSEVRAALAAHVGARREKELATAEFALLTERAALLSKRVQAGEEARGAVLRATVAANQAAQDVESANRRSEAARVVLARALGVSMRALDGVALDWPGFETPRHSPTGPSLPPDRVVNSGPAPNPLVDHALVNRVDVRRALVEYATAEARLALEVARQYPDVALGPGFQWDRGDHKWRLGFSIPLPVFDQHRGAIAEASAARAVRESEFVAVQAGVLGDIELAVRNHGHAEREHTRALGVEEDLERIAAAAKRARELGEGDALQVNDAELELARARRATWLATVRLQEAIGAVTEVLATPIDGLALPAELAPVPEEGRP